MVDKDKERQGEVMRKQERSEVSVRSELIANKFESKCNNRIANKLHKIWNIRDISMIFGHPKRLLKKPFDISSS